MIVHQSNAESAEIADLPDRGDVPDQEKPAPGEGNVRAIIRVKPRPKLLFCNSKIEMLFGCDRPILKLNKLEMLELDPLG